MEKQVIDNAKKEETFRFIGDDFVGFGRKLSCVEHAGAFWTAVTMETAEKNTIVVVRQIGDERKTVELPQGPLYHGSVLMTGENNLGIAWNEFGDGVWRIKYAAIHAETLEIGPIEDVYSSSRLCLPPAGVQSSDVVQLVWPAELEGRTRIMHATGRDHQWTDPTPVSDAGSDAFRPTVALSGEALHIFWDQYRDKTYEVGGVTVADSGAVSQIMPLTSKSERWFCPDATVAKDGIVYLTWVAMQEVSDDLGIADHAAFVLAGRLNGDKVDLLATGDDGGYPGAVGDLREGLLASKVSKGYLGQRRRPMVSADGAGGVWCFWEVRVEAEATAICGHLAGRYYDGKRWSEPCLLGNPGYGYAVPKQIGDGDIPVAHFSYAGKGLEIIQHSQIAKNEANPYKLDASRWQRWHTFDIEPLVKPTRTVETDGARYAMFWADTHCHSNFSADAEGEPDELIHYARDIAGLDALCLIDNDFYPNKTLSPAEWQIHLDNSRRFTKNGEFVLFPGYEFTYHRRDLTPDFNHRCVIYPGPEGQLLRRIDKGTNTDAKLVAALPDRVICYPHHSSYELMDNEKERNIEACSSWRVVLAENDFTLQQLLAGRKLGFIGSSDAHRANAGLGGALTGLFAPELTHEALYDAYRNRRIIATQGFAVFIDFRVAGLFIGSQGQCEGAPEITAEIEAPHEIEYVRVLRDGEEIFRSEPATDSCSFSFTDKTASAGEHFYYLNLKLVGEPAYNMDPAKNALGPFTGDSKYPHNLARARGVFAWTSPIWCGL